ncbi:unnamed protein product [Dicrocoelium dendriticum]|nr:unnamed protein product [Dicrocoelium dendriticum]
MCAMTCDPDQANFLTPMIGGNLVRSVMYNLTVSVKDGFFTSCKDVRFSDGRSVDLMCDSEVCTPELLLRGLEDHSPFPLKFVVTPDYKYGSLNVSEKRAYNHPMYSCNQAVPARGSDSGGPSCSCTDCEGSCQPRVSASPLRVLSKSIIYSESRVVLTKFMHECPFFVGLLVNTTSENFRRNNDPENASPTTAI